MRREVGIRNWGGKSQWVVGSDGTGPLPVLISTIRFRQTNVIHPYQVAQKAEMRALLCGLCGAQVSRGSEMLEVEDEAVHGAVEVSVAVDLQ